MHHNLVERADGASKLHMSLFDRVSRQWLVLETKLGYELASLHANRYSKVLLDESLVIFYLLPFSQLMDAFIRRHNLLNLE